MYSKIFQQIYDSSIADDYRLRQFFIDMIVLADLDGVVNMTHEAIAARTRIPLRVVKIHIQKLSEPDPRSQNPAQEGRRIVLLDPDNRDWGWQIVNFREYHLIASDEQRREKTRDRVKRFKERKKANLDDGNAVVTQVNAGNATQTQTYTHTQTKEEIVSLWNRFAEDHKLSTILKLSSKREAAVNCRLGEKEFDFQNILEMIAGSDFLRGKNNNGWKVDFDFVFCSTNNYLKILEGKYANASDRRSSTGNNAKAGGSTTVDNLKSSLPIALRLVEQRERHEAEKQGRGPKT